MNKLFYIFLITLGVQSSIAQETKKWNGKECAVVLTYDDSLDEHLDNVVPCLNKYGLKGTFYIIGSSDCFVKRKKEWKKVALQEHELGNHTLMHPCANTPKRKVALPPEKDLNNYSLKQVVDEIKETNELLFQLDKKEKRTFAFPCGHRKVNDTMFYDYLAKDFVAARGVKRSFNTIDDIKIENINANGMKGHTGKEMVELVQQALKEKKLLVFLFHGVGGGSPLNVEKEAHEELLNFLSKNQKKIWVAPMVTVASYIKKINQIKK
ncbi:polysaccharide deacetylase family protein [Wenyingzhuangia sp. IMCC45574]